MLFGTRFEPRLPDRDGAPRRRVPIEIPADWTSHMASLTAPGLWSSFESIKTQYRISLEPFPTETFFKFNFVRIPLSSRIFFLITLRSTRRCNIPHLKKIICRKCIAYRSKYLEHDFSQISCKSQ
ncbi:hypothetical protein AVEN_58502-1 [Araneus ventricosus]|uniref:Uncharacterized protein n=1 Tax=Araneus ventricosus TaxID=182803 RepID=A0A4Y2IAV5_ARAVE|nr:hypothetical protein AVEN_58502-1 [Araneus ventricosus]